MNHLLVRGDVSSPARAVVIPRELVWAGGVGGAEEDPRPYASNFEGRFLARCTVNVDLIFNVSRPGPGPSPSPSPGSGTGILG
jgi:hypothetical protein